MRLGSVGAAALVCVGLGCFSGKADGRASGAPTEAIDRIVVKKGEHSITLYAGERAVFSTKVAIGPGGTGPKLREGDKVTPVGRYKILSKTPSRFHTFMRLDYPNADDQARFQRLKKEGTLPAEATIGGDIGIHGAPPQVIWKPVHKLADWTLGCVAVDDDEIEAIARRTPVGTVVDIVD
jgi:murein L,D-transpeptidase YafK